MDIDGNPIDTENYCGKRVGCYIKDGPILFFGTVRQGVEWNTDGAGRLWTIDYAGEDGKVHETETVNKTTLKQRLLCYNHNKDKDHSKQSATAAAGGSDVDNNIDNPFEGQGNNNNRENRGGDRRMPILNDNGDSGRGGRGGRGRGRPAGGRGGRGGRSGGRGRSGSANESTNPKFHNEDDKTIETFPNYNPMKPNIKFVQHTDPREKPKDPYEPIFKISDKEKFEAKFTLRPSVDAPWSDSDDDDDEHREPDPKPTVDLMSNLMLPQSFIKEIVHQSNGYIKWRIQQPPMILDKKTNRMKRNNNHLRGKDINNLDPSDLLSESGT